MKEAKRFDWELADGWCGAMWTNDGIMAFDFWKESSGDLFEGFDGSVVEKISAKSVPVFIKNAKKLVQDFFAAKQVEFDVPLDLRLGTEFQQRVWIATRKIPYGSVQTYGWVAEEMGEKKAARAVGAALGANPIPIIVPCHRVLAAGNRIGGFSRGIDEKLKLLALEQIE